MRDQRIRKGIATRKPRETREAFEPVSIENPVQHVSLDAVRIDGIDRTADR